MTVARGFEAKTRLTQAEKLTCAYFHLLRGISQQTLADLFRVNSGRVNEAVAVVREALERDETRPAIVSGGATI